MKGLREVILAITLATSNAFASGDYDCIKNARTIASSLEKEPPRDTYFTDFPADLGPKFFECVERQVPIESHGRLYLKKRGEKEGRVYYQIIFNKSLNKT